jgi:hypothetical protein
MLNSSSFSQEARPTRLYSRWRDVYRRHLGGTTKRKHEPSLKDKTRIGATDHTSTGARNPRHQLRPPQLLHHLRLWFALLTVQQQIPNLSKDTCISIRRPHPPLALVQHQHDRTSLITLHYRWAHVVHRFMLAKRKRPRLVLQSLTKLTHPHTHTRSLHLTTITNNNNNNDKASSLEPTNQRTIIPILMMIPTTLATTNLTTPRRRQRQRRMRARRMRVGVRRVMSLRLGRGDLI